MLTYRANSLRVRFEDLDQLRCGLGLMILDSCAEYPHKSCSHFTCFGVTCPDNTTPVRIIFSSGTFCQSGRFLSDFAQSQCVFGSRVRPACVKSDRRLDTPIYAPIDAVESGYTHDIGWLHRRQPICTIIQYTQTHYEWWMKTKLKAELKYRYPLNTPIVQLQSGTSIRWLLRPTVQLNC